MYIYIYIYIYIFIWIEGNLEVKLLTIWTHGKAKVGGVREEKESEDKESKERRFRKNQVREKVAKSRDCGFRMIWGSKSRLAKAAGAE